LEFSCSSCSFITFSNIFSGSVLSLTNDSSFSEGVDTPAHLSAREMSEDDSYFNRNALATGIQGMSNLIQKPWLSGGLRGIEG